MYVCLYIPYSFLCYIITSVCLKIHLFEIFALGQVITSSFLFSSRLKYVAVFQNYKKKTNERTR